MEFLVAVLVLLVFIAWAAMSSRIRELRDRVDELAAKPARLNNELIAGLTRRVYALEQAVTSASPAAESKPVAPSEVPAEAVVSSPPIKEPAPLPLPTPPPEPKPAAEEVVTASSEPELEPVKAPSFAMVGAAPEPRPPHPDVLPHLRERMGGQEWEALVGGNWLNKLGVLVLVIGIALLLSYSFTQTGPAGRVAIGFLVSFAMLAGGIVLERRERYRIFARGLLGGGWAALYFTTYAMHAIPAARVLENSYLASALLLAVAAGMVLHSLRYHSQTVSGLAYFIAFATLALSDVTLFAVIALIPLAAALLYCAFRFSWFLMAFFGLFATYGTLISRGDTGAPLASTQATFAAYWLLFEAFDFLRTLRRVSSTTLLRFILPLNAGAFLLLSWRKWESMAPADVWKFFAAAAAVYLASALLRAKVRPPSTFSENEDTLDRAALGGYEGPVTISAFLAAVAIWLKAPTVWINAGLLVEGEILFLAGLRFGERHLRRLAGAAFGVSLAKLAVVDIPAQGTNTLANIHMTVWTPVAAAHAAAFYLNRFLRDFGRAFSWAAAVVVAAILTAEVHDQYLSVAYFGFAILLFEFGFRQRLSEFRYQGYALALLAAITGVTINVVASPPGWRLQWLPIAISTAISYAAAIRVRSFQPDRLADWEAAALRRGGSIGVAVFGVSLIWKLAPGDYLGLAWIALGALLFELGLRGLPRELRWCSYAVSGMGAAWVLVLQVFQIHKYAAAPVRISLAVAALIGYGIAARIFRSNPLAIPDSERTWVRDCNSVLATTFLMTVSWVVLPDAVVAVGWAAAGLVLLEIGFRAPLGSFRLQGSLVEKVVFFRLFFANFTDLGHTGWLSHRLLTVLPIIISEYYIWFRYQNAGTADRERSAARLYLYAPAILAVVLSRFEFGRALTVTGWAPIAFALYFAGVRKHNADLRWQSYAVGLLTFWRCWNTNFYAPESLAGVPGRVLTGSLVVITFYAAQLVSPRPAYVASSGVFQWLDQNSRLLFSSLASGLLALMLYYQVSGGLLTVAWTAQAMAMIVAGFPLRDRPLRLTGLLLFLVCILKVFLWDLRHLETLQRIMSFLVLGLILVGVSWIYTRFRDRIQRLL